MLAKFCFILCFLYPFILNLDVFCKKSIVLIFYKNSLDSVSIVNFAPLQKFKILSKKQLT